MRTLIRQDFTNAFNQCDLILTPTTPTTAFTKGAKNDPLEMYLADIYTISINLAGICGLSLPCGCSPDGLPVGMQLVAPAMAEKLLLQTGFAFEREFSPNYRFAEV